MGLFEFIKSLFVEKSQRPLGNLTYDEAEFYIDRYAELLTEGRGGVGARESALPTSFERMKEAFKVECLRLCNQGMRFDKAAETLLSGYVHLGHFLPDDLSRQAPVKYSGDLLRKAWGLPANSDAYRIAMQTAKAAMKGAEVASEVTLWKIQELNVEWNEFVRIYRDRYVQIEREIDEEVGGLTDSSRSRRPPRPN